MEEKRKELEEGGREAGMGEKGRRGRRRRRRKRRRERRARARLQEKM